MAIASFIVVVFWIVEARLGVITRFNWVSGLH